MGSVELELQSMQNTLENRQQAMHQIVSVTYVLLDAGNTGKGSNTVLDNDIKAYMKDKTHPH